MTGLIDHRNDHSADELDALRERLNAALDADSSAAPSSAEQKPIVIPAPMAKANWGVLHSIAVLEAKPRRMTRGDWFRVALAIVVVAAVVWVLRSV